ncbi:DUF883 family protein [Methylocaldum szegediense]|uniref:ElaB protein n=1 Tax=Methylocaldum szegediense TaxID=73780 RepID=A0ABM9I794_9GAMM|nr:hypothetical protein [Methylocaldum szegediense]CAI8938194.1 ElaB protein [Methylocaldum szegediense]
MATTEDITKDLRQDLATLKADVGNLMAAMKDLGVEHGRTAYERARDVGERARGHALAAQESVEHYIEARPLTSLLVAFGTGFAIGTLLASRR